MSAPEPQPASGRPARIATADLAVAGLLAAAAIALYLPCIGFDFVRFDDDLYVSENANVLAGLGWHGLRHAFTLGAEAAFIPLTLLSHMLDASLFGSNAAGHHFTSLLLHGLNAALLYLLLARATGRRLRAGLVTALFAAHPLQVESVAWISERKNVLSTLLALLCIAAYAAYRKRPTVGRYLVVGALLAAGLLAKPMLVTLPVLLLVLDYWPLGGAADRPFGNDLRRRVLEKVPLLLLSLICSGVTVFAQHGAGAIQAGAPVALTGRMGNALISSLQYLYALVWPLDLSVQYSHPYLPKTGGVAPTAGELLAVALVLLLISALAVRSRRRYLLAGWLWYLIALAPVIGLIQVGTQGWADRYAYVPLLGIFVMLVWGGADLLAALGRTAAGPLLRAGALAIAAAWICALAGLTHFQQQHWRDTRALFSQAVRVNPGHARMHDSLGSELLRLGQPEEAALHYYIAVQLDPSPTIYGALATVLLQLGRVDQAIEQYRQLIALPDARPDHFVNLGNLLVSRGQAAEGISVLKEAVGRDPGSYIAQYNLANALARAERFPEAIEGYRRAAALQPKDAKAIFNWGNVLAMQGDFDAAIAKFRQAAELDPHDRQALAALDRALQHQRH